MAKRFQKTYRKRRDISGTCKDPLLVMREMEIKITRR